MEGSLLAVIETSSELNLGNRARTEVTNTTRGVGGGSSTAVGGVVTSAGVGVGVSIACTSNNTTLVVNGGDISELGADTEDGVEGIGLTTGLSGNGTGGGTSLLASILGGLVSFARVGQSITDGLGDDIDVLSRAVGVGGCDKQCQARINMKYSQKAYSCRRAGSSFPCGCRSQ